MYCETYLDLPRELVVAEDVDSGELSYLVKLELDLHWLAAPGVVPPADPPLAWIQELTLGKIIQIRISHMKMNGYV